MGEKLAIVFLEEANPECTFKLVPGSGSGFFKHDINCPVLAYEVKTTRKPQFKGKISRCIPYIIVSIEDEVIKIQGPFGGPLERTGKTLEGKEIHAGGLCCPGVQAFECAPGKITAKVVMHNGQVFETRRFFSASCPKLVSDGDTAFSGDHNTGA